jgi:hypothetical protein
MRIVDAPRSSHYKVNLLNRGEVELIPSFQLTIVVVHLRVFS